MFLLVRASRDLEGSATATRDALVAGGMPAVLQEATASPRTQDEQWRHLVTRLDAGTGLDQGGLSWLGEGAAVASCDLQVPFADESGGALVLVDEIAAVVGATGGLLFVAADDLVRLCGDGLSAADRTELAAQWAQVHGLALVLVLSDADVVAVKGDGRTQDLAGQWTVDDPVGRGQTVARLLAAYVRCPADLAQALPAVGA